MNNELTKGLDILTSLWLSRHPLTKYEKEARYGALSFHNITFYIRLFTMET